MKRKLKNWNKFELCFTTFVRSKSGVSSVVVLVGGFVGEIALITPLDAVPTPWAAADEAFKILSKKLINYEIFNFLINFQFIQKLHGSE